MGFSFAFFSLHPSCKGGYAMLGGARKVGNRTIEKRRFIVSHPPPLIIKSMNLGYK